MAQSEDNRDDGAGLRLTAAALRLGVFTVRELSTAADTHHSTARDFVARRRASGLLVVVDEPLEQESAEEPATGRPPLRYRIADNQRRETEARLRALRDGIRKLGPAQVGDGVEDNVGALALLERAVLAFSDAMFAPGPEREARISEIGIIRRAAERDLKALTSQDAAPRRVAQFEERLKLACEQFRFYEEWSGHKVPEEWRKLADDFVTACHGYWAGAIASAGLITNFAVVLEGISGRDPVSAKVRQAYADNAAPVAMFPIDNYRPSDWARLTECIGTLVRAAPSCVSEMLITVDGRRPEADVMLNKFSGVKEAFAKGLVNIMDPAEIGKSVIARLRGEQYYRGRAFCLDVAGQPETGYTCRRLGINYLDRSFVTLKSTTNG